MKVVPQTAAKALTVKNAAAIKAAAPKRARHAATAQARVTAPLTPAAPRVKTALHLVIVLPARHAPRFHTKAPASQPTSRLHSQGFPPASRHTHPAKDIRTQHLRT